VEEVRRGRGSVLEEGKSKKEKGKRREGKAGEIEITEGMADSRPRIADDG
jgi:hypothetical protein